MSDEPIGSARVAIVGDYSKLSTDFKAAETAAGVAGEKIASSFNASSIKIATLQLSISNLKQKLEELQSAGVRTAAQQQQMDNTAARLTLQNMKLAASFQEVGHAADVTGKQATSGFIRVAEGSNALRAVETFMAQTLKLGPAMQMLFPLIGGFAFAELLGRIGGEIAKIFTDGAHYAERFRGEVDQLNNEFSLENDKLQTTNDKLAESIGKLTGHPSNGLKAVIDEAIEASDELEKHLLNNFKTIEDVLKKGSVGIAAGFFTGNMPTNVQEAQYAKQDAAAQRTIAQITWQTDQRLKGLKAQADAAQTAAEKKAAIDAADETRADARNRIQKVFNELVADTATRQSEAQSKVSAGAQTVGIGGVPTNATNLGQKAILMQGAARLDALRETNESMVAMYEGTGFKQKETIAKAGKEAEEAAKKAAEQWYKTQEEHAADMEMSTLQEENFWRNNLVTAQHGGEAYLEISRQIQSKLKGLLTKHIEELKKDGEDIYKAIEETLKQTEERVGESGGHPAAVRLQMLQDLADEDLPEDVVEKLAEQIPAAQKAANREALEDLKRTLAEEDLAWRESGDRTERQVKARAESVAAYLESLRPFFVGIDTLIDAEAAKIAAANKRIYDEGLKIEEILLKSRTAQSDAGIDQQKVAIEQAYGAAIVHTYQSQLAYEDQIATLTMNKLALKLQEAEIEHERAMDEEDFLKMAQTSFEIEKAKAAIQLQAAQSAGQRSAAGRDQSFGGQFLSGTANAMGGAFSAAASALTAMVMQAKNWGQEFRNVLTNLERQLTQSLFGALTKQVENLGKNALQGILGNSGGGGILGSIGQKLGGALFGQSPQIAATTANTAAMTALNIHLGAMLAAMGINTTATATNATTTAAHGGIMASHMGVMLAHMGTMLAHMGIMIANTVATIANTLAVVWNSIVEGVKAIFGWAEGGRPTPNVPAIIGERGPELWIPDSPGTIMPNSQLAHVTGSSSRTNNWNTGMVGDLHVHMYDTRNPRENVRQIANYVKLATRTGSPLNA